MDKEALKALGLTDEQVAKIHEDYGKNYVTKAQFNERAGELKHGKEEREKFHPNFPASFPAKVADEGRFSGRFFTKGAFGGKIWPYSVFGRNIFSGRCECEAFDETVYRLYSLRAFFRRRACGDFGERHDGGIRFRIAAAFGQSRLFGALD